MHTEVHSSLLDLWENVQRIEDESLSEIVYEVDRVKYVLVLLVRIVELSRDCFILLNEHRIASVPIIQRSALETFLDMKCMIKDEAYEVVMQNEYNNYMAGLSATLEDGEEKKYLERVKETKKINIQGKFRKADELPLYKNFYKSLTRHAHGNLDRVVVDHTKNGNIIFNLEPSPERFLLTLNQVIALKAEALKECLSFLENKDEYVSELSTIINKLEALDDA